ncbi:MAG: methionine--tRNA ligase subunit beta, partial [Ginsengibacter sp.]
EPFLNQWILEEHKDWKNNVYGQCKSWLDKGLQSRAMTRDSDWGVKVPLPDEVLYSSPPAGGGGREGVGKVLYVWFDAPIGYISTTKELTDNWKDYWCREDTKLIHFIGKDNIVFHCIIFPAMLKAHGNFVLPENVPANEFLNIEGEKVSTSRNWAVWLDDYLIDFPGQQDALRYVLCANAPETKDNDFTWKDFQDRTNNELVAIFGNFVNRTFVLMHKLCKGKVPALHVDVLDELDNDIMEEFQSAAAKAGDLIEEFKFRDALYEIIDLARKGNKYLQQKEPWKKASVIEQLQNNAENIDEISILQKHVDNTLHACLQLTANLAVLINPFLPFTATKMCYMMKVVDKMLDWGNAGKTKLLSVGYSLRAPELLFRKIENEEVSKQVEKLKSNKIQSENNNKQPVKNSDQEKSKTENNLMEQNKSTESPSSSSALENPGVRSITFDDFSKIALKVGTIITAAKVEKADKLLKLEIDLGAEKRIIVSGIALHFKPEEIIGKQVVVVANLAPRKMRGIESNGMILMAEDKDGKLHFVSPDEKINEGSPVT